MKCIRKRFRCASVALSPAARKHLMAQVEASRGSERTPVTLRAVAEQRDVVMRGDTGPEVRRAQQLLNRRGAHLDVDGIFGEKTEAAVRHFQRTHKLEVDGRIGDKTLKKLLEKPGSNEHDSQELGDH